MHILHIVGTLNPAAGGPSEAIRMLVRHAPAGCTAEIATLDDPAAPFLRDLSCPVHALGGPQKSWYSPKLIPWLRANRPRFDGVFVHGLWQFIGWAAMRAFAGRIPYVVFAHGMLDPWFKRTYPRKHFKKWLYWLLAEYWILRRAHRVLFTSALERDLAAGSFWLHRWHPVVAPLGSEPPPADPETLRAAFHGHCPELAGMRFLLFLGRIHPKKGCDLLTQAFAEIAPSYPDLHLVIAGPDPSHWRAQLEPALLAAGVADRVHWPGMLEGQAKWGAFAACEVFILPSHQENFGIAAVEALASAKPVLLCDPVNIAPDLAAAGCALTEPDTLSGVHNLLTRWLALTPAAHRAMSDRALQTFHRHYDMRYNTEAILRILETALSHPTRNEAPFEVNGPSSRHKETGSALPSQTVPPAEHSVEAR